MLKLLLTAVLLLICGCSIDPVSKSRTDNPDAQVDKLFTTDGCTVYRFADKGRLHYFVRCSNGTQSTFGTQHHGKTGIPYTIQTLEDK